EGVAAYRPVGAATCRPTADSRAGGDFPHDEKYEAIVCVDGMHIFSNAEVVSSHWIALPLPEIYN
ncbi:MAG: hypothetical protein FWC40_07180, partial [Proteobacteria bacterium]|nr:hypothetical protein [Pseudomonadota bacterium]